MDVEFYIFLFIAGTIAGISSGLLGIGGAIILIPILRYVPQFINLQPLSMHVITGITSLQTTFSTGAASYFHHRSGNVSYTLVINVGIGIAIGALSGAVLSRYVSEEALLGLYAVFILFAGVLLFARKDKDDDKEINKIRIKRYKAISFGLIVGLIAGALGVAGSVVIIPLLNTLFSVPIKICISSGTHIGFIASLMTFSGKLVTGQFELISAIIISISATLGAFVGTYINRKLSPKILKTALIIVILITLVTVILDLFS